MGSPSTTTTTNSVPQSVLDQYNSLIGRATSVANTPYTAYTGQLTAGLTGLQNEALSGLSNVNNIATPYLQEGSGQSSYGFDVSAAASPYYSNAASTINSASPYFSQAGQIATKASGPVNATQYMSPYTQSVVDTTLANINQSNAIQQNDLTSKAIQNGVAFGGDRAGLAAAELARNQDLSRDQTIAQLFNSGYSQSLSAAEQDASRQGQIAQTLGGIGSATVGAGNALTSVGNSVTNQGSTLSNIGAQQAGLGTQATNNAINSYNAQLSGGSTDQNTTQNALTAAYNQFVNKLSYPFQTTGWLGNQVLGVGSNSGGTSTTSSPSWLSSLFSDERLKEDKRVIGETFDGQPIYSFRYKGQPQTHLGLMAQEVERHHPDAVGQVAGLKTVDYRRATDDAAERGHFQVGGLVRYANGGTMPYGVNQNSGPYGSSTGTPYASGLSIVPDNSSILQFAGRNTIPHSTPPQNTQSNPIKSATETVGAYKGIKGLYNDAKGMFGSSNTPAAWTSATEMANPGGLPISATGGLGGAAETAGSAAGTTGAVVDASIPVAAATEAGTSATAAASDLLPLVLLARNGGFVPGYDIGGAVPDDNQMADYWKPAPMDSPEPTAGLVPQQSLGAPLGLVADNSNSTVPAVAAINNAAPVSTGDVYRKAISSIESDGSYDLVGPKTRNGDHAYGKYQVMGRNIPEWTEQVLGKPLTPAEFLANPSAQDAVFNAKFGALADKYGPQGAARAWFAGEGGMNDPNRKDVLGTSVADYENKFNSALGYSGDQQPTAGLVRQPTDQSISRIPPREQSGLDQFVNGPGMAIAAGILGMLGSRSPDLAGAIAAGGLSGLGVLQEQAKTRRDIDAHPQIVDAGDRKIIRYADGQQITIPMMATPAQKETNRHNQVAESLAAANQPIIIGPDGKPSLNPAWKQKTEFEKSVAEDKVKPGIIDYRDDGTPINGFIDSTNKKYYLPGGVEYTPKNPNVTAQPGTETPSVDQIDKSGTIKVNTAQSSAPYNYSKNAPVVEKGSEVPPPASVAGKSPDTIKAEAEYYLETGKFLTPVTRSSTVNSIQQQNYRTSVQNYANAIAASRGMSPAEVAEGWRTAPAMTKFILGPDGRSTVALGTAERHLETLRQYIAAYNGNDQPALRRIGAIIDKQFGKTGATTIDAMSSIVGPEIVKALGVAGAGTESERSNFEHMFQLGGKQAQAAIAGITQLLGGQLEGKERQAREVGVSQDRFKRLIGEDEYNKIKSEGSGVKGADGKPENGKPKRVRQNGFEYDLQPDGSYKVVK